MKKTIYDYRDYRHFLRAALDAHSPRRGARSALARHLACQTAFISQVLAEKVHLSLEHGMKVGDFLQLPPAESRFFMLLLHQGRAGSHALRDYYQLEIARILEQRKQVDERIDVKRELGVAEQAVYYDGWHASAIHVALSLAKSQSAQAISRRLGLPLAKVQEILEFLARTGMARQQGSEYAIGETRIHVKRGSPLVRKHHLNWRLKAMTSLDTDSRDDLHYSGVFTLSREDFGRIRDILLESLERAEPVLRASPEETMGALCLDWFAI
jgi:uncharacterized protein (TIGR02147 family)